MNREEEQADWHRDKEDEENRGSIHKGKRKTGVHLNSHSGECTESDG